MGINIRQRTSTANTSVKYNRPIEYLVIHYTAGGTSRSGTAWNTAYMFAHNSRPASADFIVDDTDIVQYNGDIKNRYTYAVGGKLQGNPGGGKFYGKCKNYNSISIEICSSNKTGNMKYPNTKDWYFTTAALNNAIKLAQYLMEKYHIPANHLIRHYDVNQKLCLPIYETELLTPDGWKLLADIEVGDVVAQYDTQADNITFGEVLDTVEPYETNILCNRDIKATINHRMWVMPTGGTPAKFREMNFGAIRKAKQRYVVKNGAVYHGNGLELSDNELRLLVWIQGHGHYMADAKGIEFYLKNDRNIKHLQEVLNNLGYEYITEPHEDGSYVMRVCDGNIVMLAEKYLDNMMFDWNLLEMTKKQFDIFWNELVVANTYATNATYRSDIRQNLDVIQALCATKGIRTNLYPEIKSILINRDNYTIGPTKSIDIEAAVVSCVTVPTEYILIRQNGTTFIVGNCPGIIGWNKESGSEVKWIDFKNKVLNKSAAPTTKPTVKPEVKEDELDMTKAEFLKSLTNEEAYTLLSKASAYAESLPEPDWSKKEGAWAKATSKGIVNGTDPQGDIKRCEMIAVLGRLGLI